MLGGGDGGIATQALRYDTVERILVVEIDASVTETSRRFFPAVSAGFSDPRCEVVHVDALAWVQRSGEELFDLIVIDFTDEPVRGLWSEAFFLTLQGLLSPGGLLIQNMGTMMVPEELVRLFRFHTQVFPATFVMSAMLPDYVSPYILALSSNGPLDPLEVDWPFWERQRILPIYYGRELHRELFVAPADVLRLLGAPVPPSPARPLPLAAVSPSVAVAAEDCEAAGQRYERLHRELTPYGTLEVEREVCRPGRSGEGCLSLSQNQERVLNPFSAYRSEAMVLPALGLLGGKARRLLVLGGGVGELVAVALRSPSVEKIVVVEIDEALVGVVRRWFPVHSDRAFGDSRVELVFADALEWLRGGRGRFDAVFANLVGEPWRNASRTSRVPRTMGFVRRLGELLEPHGLLVQDIGSIQTPRDAARSLELHREAFPGGSVWPMSLALLDGDIKAHTELDGHLRRPPWLLVLSSRGRKDPCAVDWSSLGADWETTSYYHPSLHQALFVLPAELQRLLDAPPPCSTAADGSPASLEGAGAATTTTAAAASASASATSDAGTAAQEAALVFGLAIEARGCQSKALNHTEGASDLLHRMAALGGLTPLWGRSHQFEPQGVTALLMVSESHLGLHTWPEWGYAVLDVVSCKAIDAAASESMLDAVRTMLRCGNVTGRVSLRGFGVGAEDRGAEAESPAGASRIEL